MRYNDLGSTGLKISAITYGGIVSTMGNYRQYSFPYDGQQASDDYVSYALEAGINYFDVSPRYGDAQEKLGNSLKGTRDRIVLACKTAFRDYDSAARDVENSLKLLHTDHFDVYQLHAIRSVEEIDRAFEKDGVMRLMEELKRSGTARNIGITAHCEDAALKAVSLYDFDTVLFSVNWQMNKAVGYGDRIMKAAREKGMGVICMKSMIERGFRPDDDDLRRRWPKSWALPFDPESQKELLLAAMRYSVSKGIDTLIPAGDIEHFRFAVEHADDIWETPISAEEMKMLDEHLELVKDSLFMAERER